jgi:hypothetical protein
VDIGRRGVEEEVEGGGGGGGDLAMCVGVEGRVREGRFFFGKGGWVSSPAAAFNSLLGLGEVRSTRAAFIFVFMFWWASFFQWDRPERNPFISSFLFFFFF